MNEAKWRDRGDLNPHSADRQSDALPLSYYPNKTLAGSVLQTDWTALAHRLDSHQLNSANKSQRNIRYTTPLVGVVEGFGPSSLTRWSAMRDSHPRYLRPKRSAIATRRMTDKMDAGAGVKPAIGFPEGMGLVSVSRLVPAIKWW